MLTITAITVQWQWGPRVTVPTTAVLLAVYVAAAGFDGAAVLRVLLECVLARVAFQLLRRSSRRVDERGYFAPDSSSSGKSLAPPSKKDTLLNAA